MMIIITIIIINIIICIMFIKLFIIVVIVVALLLVFCRRPIPVTRTTARSVRCNFYSNGSRRPRLWGERADLRNVARLTRISWRSARSPRTGGARSTPLRAVRGGCERLLVSTYQVIVQYYIISYCNILHYMILY